MNGMVTERTYRRTARGFTLIEILVVVAVITVLASIAVFMGIQLKKGSSEKATKATLAALDSAMKDYMKDQPEPAVTVTTATITYGPYPSPVGSAGDWVIRLMADPAAAKVLDRLNLVIIQDPQATQFGFRPNTQVVIDGFRNPILYFPANPTGGLPTGHFKSYGADGGTGKSQDGKIDYGTDDFFSAGTAP